MGDFRNSAAFDRLVSTFVQRANQQGWQIDTSGAAVVLADRITRVAALTRRATSAVVRDYRSRDVITFVDASIRARADVGAQPERADERAVVVTGRQFAGLVGDLAWVLQVAAHSADLDTVNVAADALRDLSSAFMTNPAEATVSARTLHMVQRAFARARRGLGSGWRVRDDGGPEQARLLLGAMDDAFGQSDAEIAILLERLV